MSSLVQRPSRKRGFRLTETGDIELLLLTFRYRLVTVEILACLTGRSPASIYRRVAKLVSHGYLFRIVRPLQAHAFTSTRKGIATLVARGLADTEALDKRFRAHELKASFPLFLDHEISLSTTHACLSLAARQSEIRLVDWRQGPTLYDRVWFSENGSRRHLPVRPDALFTLEDTRRTEGRNRLSCFLECDRSTASHSRYKQKLLAYLRYSERGVHHKLGIKKFRVVTVTLTSARAQNLCEAAAELLPSGRARQLFFFTSIDNFSLEQPGPLLQDAIFLRPGDHKDARHALIPPIKDSAQREKA